jgi:hypothetical protein
MGTGGRGRWGCEGNAIKGLEIGDIYVYFLGFEDLWGGRGRSRDVGGRYK